MEFVVRWRNLWESFLQLSLRFYLVIIFSFKPIFFFRACKFLPSSVHATTYRGPLTHVSFFFFPYHCVKDRAEEKLKNTFVALLIPFICLAEKKVAWFRCSIHDFDVCCPFTHRAILPPRGCQTTTACAHTHTTIRYRRRRECVPDR